MPNPPPPPRERRLSDDMRSYVARQKRSKSRKERQRRRYAEDHSPTLREFKRMQMWELFYMLRAKEELTAEEEREFNKLRQSLFVARK
jgi:hypothetical protein